MRPGLLRGCVCGGQLGGRRVADALATPIQLRVHRFAPGLREVRHGHLDVGARRRRLVGWQRRAQCLTQPGKRGGDGVIPVVRLQPELRGAAGTADQVSRQQARDVIARRHLVGFLQGDNEAGVGGHPGFRVRQRTRGVEAGQCSRDGRDRGPGAAHARERCHLVVVVIFSVGFVHRHDVDDIQHAVLDQGSDGPCRLQTGQAALGSQVPHGPDAVHLAQQRPGQRVQRQAVRRRARGQGGDRIEAADHRQQVGPHAIAPGYLSEEVLDGLRLHQTATAPFIAAEAPTAHGAARQLRDSLMEFLKTSGDNDTLLDVAEVDEQFPELPVDELALLRLQRLRQTVWREQSEADEAGTEPVRPARQERGVDAAIAQVDDALALALAVAAQLGRDVFAKVKMQAAGCGRARQVA